MSLRIKKTKSAKNFLQRSLFWENIQNILVLKNILKDPYFGKISLKISYPFKKLVWEIFLKTPFMKLFSKKPSLKKCPQKAKDWRYNIKKISV